MICCSLAFPLLSQLTDSFRRFDVEAAVAAGHLDFLLSHMLAARGWCLALLLLCQLTDGFDGLDACIDFLLSHMLAARGLLSAGQSCWIVGAALHLTSLLLPADEFALAYSFGRFAVHSLEDLSVGAADCFTAELVLANFRFSRSSSFDFRPWCRVCRSASRFFGLGIHVLQVSKVSGVIFVAVDLMLFPEELDVRVDVAVAWVNRPCRSCELFFCRSSLLLFFQLHRLAFSGVEVLLCLAPQHSPCSQPCPL